MPPDERAARVSRELFVRSFLGGATVATAASRLARQMRDVYFPAGATIYQQGDVAEHHYFIVTGEVELSAPDAEPWKFGERSIVGILDVMADRPRARTAKATSDAHLLEVRGEDWLDLLEDNFEFTRGAVRAFAGRVHELITALAPTGGFPAYVPPPVRSSPIGQLNLVERVVLLRDIALMRSASMQALTSLAALAEEIRAPAGTPLFTRGDPITGFHIVASGHVRANRIAPHIEADFGPGSIVLGLASIGLESANFEAVAVSDTRTLRIREEDYFDVMEEHFDMARSTLAEMGTWSETLRHQLGPRMPK